MEPVVELNLVIDWQVNSSLNDGMNERVDYTIHSLVRRERFSWWS